MNIVAQLIRRELLHFSGGFRVLAGLIGFTLVLHFLAITVLVDSFSTDLLRYLKGLGIPLLSLILCGLIGAADSPGRSDRELATRPIPFGSLLFAKILLVLILAIILAGVQSLLSIASGLNNGFLQVIPVVAGAGLVGLFVGRISAKKLAMLVGVILIFYVVSYFFGRFLVRSLYSDDDWRNDEIMGVAWYFPGFDQISIALLFVPILWLNVFPRSKVWRVLAVLLLAFLVGKSLLKPHQTMEEIAAQIIQEPSLPSAQSDSLEGKYQLSWLLSNRFDDRTVRNEPNEEKDYLMLSLEEVNAIESYRTPIRLEFYYTVIEAKSGKVYRILSLNGAADPWWGDEAKVTGRILGGEEVSEILLKKSDGRDRRMSVDVLIPEELRGQMVRVHLEGLVHHWQLEDFGTLAENSNEALRTKTGKIELLGRETGERNRMNFRAIYENGPNEKISSYLIPYRPGEGGVIVTKEFRNKWAIPGMSSVENFSVMGLLAEDQKIGFFGWSYQGSSPYRSQKIVVDLSKIDQSGRLRKQDDVDLSPAQIEEIFD